MRAHQVLIDLDQSTGANEFRSRSIASIRDKANEALQLTQGMPVAEHKAKVVTKLWNSGILLELNSDEAAEWFQEDSMWKTFLMQLYVATFFFFFFFESFYQPVGLAYDGCYTCSTGRHLCPPLPGSWL